MKLHATHCPKPSSLLGSALGFKPLDRLQISSKSEVREMMTGSRDRNNLFDLPFLYFQCARPDGMLEVCSPGGYITAISPLDVCDVITGNPLIVRAMPEKSYLARLRLPLAERQARPGPECYAEAHVLRVSKDKWNRVDQTFVWFLDPALNGERPKVAPIHDEDRQIVADHARRTNMPVLTLSKGNYSADQGVAQEQELASKIAACFIKASRRGNRAVSEVLSMAGFKKISRAALNRL